MRWHSENTIERRERAIIYKWRAEQPGITGSPVRNVEQQLSTNDDARSRARGAAVPSTGIVIDTVSKLYKNGSSERTREYVAEEREKKHVQIYYSTETIRWCPSTTRGEGNNQQQHACGTVHNYGEI